jgi:hypothetical protein
MLVAAQTRRGVSKCARCEEKGGNSDKRLHDPSPTTRGKVPDFRDGANAIPSLRARLWIALSLRHNRFEIAAILSPDTPAARS